MICPACHRPASSILRTSFSLQDVSIVRSFEGYLRCQHCGVLLRNIRFQSVFRNSLILFLAAFLLIIAFSDQVYRSFGINGLALFWIIIVGLTSFLFVYFAWRYSVLEKTDEP